MKRRFVFYLKREYGYMYGGHDVYGLGVSVMVEEGDDPMLALKATNEKIWKECIAFELYDTAEEAWERLEGPTIGTHEFVKRRLNEQSELVYYPSVVPVPAVVGPRKPPRLLHVSDFIAKLNEEQPGELARRAWEATKNVGKGT